jgi:hypothetical protein
VMSLLELVLGLACDIFVPADDETYMLTSATHFVSQRGTRHSRRDIQVPCIPDALNSFISPKDVFKSFLFDGTRCTTL